MRGTSDVAFSSNKCTAPAFELSCSRCNNWESQHPHGKLVVQQAVRGTHDSEGHTSTTTAASCCNNGSSPTAEAAVMEDIPLAVLADDKSLAKEIRRLEKLMMDHAKNLEFEQAAAARDALNHLKQQALLS